MAASPPVPLPPGSRAIARALVAALGLALVSLACSPRPSVHEGELSLRDWDFAQDGPVVLWGDWQVCWGAFVSPRSEHCPTGDWASFPVPGLWSEHGRDSPIGGHGVASYRLRVELPDRPGRLVLHAGAAHTAYELWINGRRRGGSGQPAETAARTRTRLENRRYELPAAEQLTLLVHVANFEFRGGGLRREWILGRPEGVEARTGRALLLDATVASSALIAALFFAAQWTFRPGDRARGWFALCGVVIGLRTLASTVTELSDLVLPWASFEWLIRLEYLGNAALLVVPPAYFRSKVPGIMPHRLTQILQIAGLLLMPIVLLGPFSAVLATLPIVMTLGPLLLGTVLWSYGRAWRAGVPGLGTTLVAAGVWLGVLMHDILRVETGLGASIELLPYFIPLWIVSEGHSILRGYAHSYATIEKLSHELQELNLELQETEESVVRFVPLDLLRMLGRKSFRDIQPGDHTEVDVSVLSCVLPLREESPREGFARLESLVGRLGEIIRSHEGILVQSLGQELVACFPSGADAAVDAALEMQRSLRGRGGTAHGATGIANAPLVLGTAGSSRHLVSLAIGPGLDAARAVREQARRSEAPGPWIAEGTRDQLSGGYELRACDSVRASGVPGPLFEVLGRSSEAPPRPGEGPPLGASD